MPKVDANAEVYASKRLNMFFPAHNQTPIDGNLTGQCVTLNKWFLAEMTDVPNAFAARGDARYVGQTLVNQGHATRVPYGERRRGDFAVFEYGVWGHIGVLIDANRIFEENVNVGGVARRWVDGAYVYASRVGNLAEAWRPVQATIYRINSYNESGGQPPEDIVKPTAQNVIDLFAEFARTAPSQDQINFYTARDIRDLYQDLLTYEVKPDAAQVKKAFADLSELTPTQDQLNYYTHRQKGVLFNDLATYYVQNNPSKKLVSKSSVQKYIADNLN